MPPTLFPRNPYIAGKALGDERGFFGREDIFRLVENALSSPDQNALVLFGQRRIGKTSILLQLRRRLPSPPFRTIYFG
jgi:predicted AAA+ superfamily ATPase